MRVNGPSDSDSAIQDKATAAPTRAQQVDSIREAEAQKTVASTAKARKAEDDNQGAVVLDASAAKKSAIVSESEEKRKGDVAALKLEVDSGSYQVDRDKLASNILADELFRTGLS